MSKTIFVNREINADHVWINISKNKSVRAVVLIGVSNDGYGRKDINSGVYKLEDETISTVNEMIKYANEGENIRFYVIEARDTNCAEEAERSE